jgi:hypothetical protein
VLHHGRGDVHLGQLDGFLAQLEKKCAKDTLFSNLSCIVLQCSHGTLLGCGHGERPKSSSTAATKTCMWTNDTENFAHTPKFTKTCHT